MWSDSSGRRRSRPLPEARSPGRAATHLRALAGRGRPAGSPAEREAMDYCSGVLKASGFSVTEEPFDFSAAIGRWLVPLTGAVLATWQGAAAWLLAAGGDVRPLGGLGACLALILASAGYLGARHGVLAWPTHRVPSVNLVATRGTPALWVVAHVDSKSQPMPTAVRATTLLVAIGCFLWTIVGTLLGEVALAVPLVGLVCSAVVSLATVGNDSPGAADNASGVATCLSLAERLSPATPLGIVLTSGEELGLAGARAWVRGRAPGVAINLDTLDDRGHWRCMVHGAASRDLAQRVCQGMSAQSWRVSPVIPGLLTDGVALADAGWRAVTLSRGSLATLGRIHRPHDTVRHLTGDAAEELAASLATFLERQTT